MVDPNVCLRQIAKIREVALGEALPYVGRSRIGRLVYGLGGLAQGASHGLDNEVVFISRRIQDIAKTICQPSEPLDVRWRNGWKDLLSELDRLELLLGTVGKSADLSSSTNPRPFIGHGAPPDL
jgi:hypothetical protein